MRLSDPSGLFLELAVDGYQFPGQPDLEAARERAKEVGIAMVKGHDRYDDNWLFVRGHVETPSGSWDFRDPCLLTWEAQEFCRWLHRAALGQVCERVGFLEPNLAFDHAEPEADSVRLIVSFGWESRPPWVAPDVYEHTPVEFLFSKSDLAAAAADLEWNLAEYPER